MENMTSIGFGPEPPAPEKLYTRGADYPYLFRLLHWLLAPSLAVLAASGLSQHAVAAPQWSLFGGVLPGFLWSGRVNLFHLWAALVFSPAVLASLWVYCRGRVMFRLTHFVLLAGGAVMVASGLLLMGWPIAPEVYRAARWTHAITAAVVSLAFVW